MGGGGQTSGKHLPSMSITLIARLARTEGRMSKLNGEADEMTGQKLVACSEVFIHQAAFKEG